MLQKAFLPQPAIPLGEDTTLIGRQVPGVMGWGAECTSGFNKIMCPPNLWISLETQAGNFPTTWQSVFISHYPWWCTLHCAHLLSVRNEQEMRRRHLSNQVPAFLPLQLQVLKCPLLSRHAPGSVLRQYLCWWVEIRDNKWASEVRHKGEHPVTTRQPRKALPEKGRLVLAPISQYSLTSRGKLKV